MTPARRSAAVLPWVIGAWACLASLQHLPFAESLVSPVAFSENDGSLGRGQALIYAVPVPRLAWSMPAGPVLQAALFLDAPRWLEPVGLAALMLAAAGAMMALGLQLGSLWCGLAVLATAQSAGFEIELFTMLVCLLAVMLAEDARRPRLATSAAVGLCVGASLLVRSELFLLPLLLAALKARRGRWRQALLVAAIPVLMLAPWAAMNRRVAGRFILLEDRRADNDVVAGALGFVQTMEGDYRSLAVVPEGQSPLVWAAGEVARHPLRSAAACAARLWLVARSWPLVIFVSLLGFALLRADPVVRGLFPLAAYYLLAHSLLPVELRYFAPIRPVLAAIGAAAALRAWRDDDISAGWRRWPAAAALGVSGALAAVTTGLVLAYPGRSLRPAALDRALERHPGQAWLWWRRGMARLSASDAAGALADLRRAMALEPERLDIRLDYAWALAALGRDPAAALSGAAQSPYERERAQLLFLLHDLDAGREGQAAPRWRQVWTAWTQADCYVRGEDARAVEATSRLRGIDTRLLHADVRDLLVAWPAQRRRRVLEALVRVFDRPESFPREDARRSFRWAAADLVDSQEMASVYELEGRGELGAARRALDDVLARNEGVAHFWSDRGVLDAMMGRREEAVRDLSKAIALDAEFLPAYATLASVHLSAGRPLQARKVYDQALSQAPAPRFKQLWETMRADRRGL